MTDLDEFIVFTVQDKAPIRGVELALEVATHKHGIDASDIEEAINRLLSNQQIIEVEYTLPDMEHRLKSLYFPAGSAIKIVRTAETVPQIRPTLASDSAHSEDRVFITDDDR